MSAKNFPYELPTLYDAIAHGVDPYRSNYDKVFEGTPYLEWSEELRTWVLPPNTPKNWATTKAN